MMTDMISAGINYGRKINPYLVSQLLRGMNRPNRGIRPYPTTQQQMNQMSALTPTGAFTGGTLQRDPSSRNYQFSEEDLIRRKQVRDARLEARRAHLRGLQQRMQVPSVEENVLGGIPRPGFPTLAFNQDLRIT